MRLFIATQLPAEAKTAIEDCIAPLRRDLPAASWGRPDNLHVTWAFIGEQPEHVIQRAHEEILGRIGASGPVEGELGETGFFPDARRARVGWIALEPHDRLVAVAAGIRKGLQSARVPFDEKKFKPHVTLVRPKAAWHQEDTARFAERTAALSGIAASIVEVSIYASVLSPHGATHTALRTILLAQEIGGQ